MPQKFVIDACVIAAWLLGEESDYANHVMDSLTTCHAVAPSYLLLEMGNVLLTNSRRRRISAEQADALLARVVALGIDLDNAADDEHHVTKLLRLAQASGLVLYDAMYLEVAHRLKLPLATLDKKLALAARKMKVEIFRP